MKKPDERQFMGLALRLAERGRGRVEPNPVVGCVVVKDGRIVGRGYHKKFGGPHAEIEALRDAGKRARGATAYVTLEPCCHHGKTGPCTEALIAAGIQRVVAACDDPYPQVAGKGVAELRNAGVGVDVGLCEPEAKAINAPFMKGVTRGLPYVICKWAMTADGAIATGDGDSKWVSSEESRRRVHELRARMDAIIVGIGTVLADDPLLTARGVPIRRIARRVVIDPKLKIPIGSRLVGSIHSAPLTVATSKSASPARIAKLRKAGVEVVAFSESRTRGVPLIRLLRHLAGCHAATNVLVEGGGRTAGPFFQAGLVDELWSFTASRLLGDKAAVRPLVMKFPAPSMSCAIPLRLLDCQRVGDDVMCKYSVT